MDKRALLVKLNFLFLFSTIVLLFVGFAGVIGITLGKDSNYYKTLNPYWICVIVSVVSWGLSGATKTALMLYPK